MNTKHQVLYIALLILGFQTGLVLIYLWGGQP